MNMAMRIVVWFMLTNDHECSSPVHNTCHTYRGTSFLTVRTCLLDVLDVIWVNLGHLEVNSNEAALYRNWIKT